MLNFSPGAADGQNTNLTGAEIRRTKNAQRVRDVEKHVSNGKNTTDLNWLAGLAGFCSMHV